VEHVGLSSQFTLSSRVLGRGSRDKKRAGASEARSQVATQSDTAPPTFATRPGTRIPGTSPCPHPVRVHTPGPSQLPSPAQLPSPIRPCPGTAPVLHVPGQHHIRATSSNPDISGFASIGPAAAADLDVMVDQKGRGHGLYDPL
jgi:hypothetical protein